MCYEVQYLSCNGMIMGQVIGDNGVRGTRAEMITVYYCQQFYPACSSCLLLHLILVLLLLLGHDDTIQNYHACVSVSDNYAQK